jgi:hypothetical protein
MSLDSLRAVCGTRPAAIVVRSRALAIMEKPFIGGPLSGRSPRWISSTCSLLWLPMSRW